jgi:hypothetical protein
LIACPGAAIVASVSNQARPTGYVVKVAFGDGVQLYDVAIPTASEAELAVGKYLQLSDLMAVDAIEPLSAAAVKALGLTPGQVRRR